MHEQGSRPQQRNPSDSLFIKATLLGASTLTVMAGATVAAALPAMQAHFADQPGVELLVRLVITMPALFIVLSASLVGIAIDRWGRVKLLGGAVVLYALAGASALVLDTLTAILVGRALLGVAVAVIMTASTTLIADYFEEQRAQFLGLQAACMAFGGVLFISLGGFLADINWREPFLIYLLALLVLPGVFWALYEPPRKRQDQGAAGAAYLPFGLVAVIYLVAFIGMMFFYVVPVQFSFYLETLIGASATLIGMTIALNTLLSGIIALGYARIQTHFTHMQIAAISFALMGIGFIIYSVAASYLHVLLGVLATGLGSGLVVPNVSLWITTAVPAEVRGRALGGMASALFLGQFLSPVMTQPVITRWGLAASFGVVGGVALLIGVGTWIAGLARRRMMKEQHQDTVL